MIMLSDAHARVEHEISPQFRGFSEKIQARNENWTFGKEFGRRTRNLNALKTCPLFNFSTSDISRNRVGYF